MHKRISTGRRRLRTLAALATSVVAGGLVTAAAAPAALAAPGSALAAAPAAGGSVSAGGPVSGTSCSAGCDLYAKAGTATVGATALPVWNFTVGDTTVTGANPVLVATVGDTLTIHLHNTLGVPVALTIPGLPGVRTDYVGVATNTTKDYTFTVSRAGTFVYQAGRITTSGANDPGPREVAMGLAGALVVRPAAAPGQDLEVSAPASAFDDESVLVLSEIDPVFAANPMTADLRAFDGKYRLINGTAWPATTQVGTAAGRKVLLRYVNAGVTSASMGVLGVKQSLVAENAYPATGQALVADTIAAGDTEDTLVTIPAGGGNFPVVDSSGRLDTAGQVDGSANRQLAFGGRMTMLSTTGGVGGSTDPGGDTVGPNTTNIAFSPNPAPANTDVTLSATFTDPKITVGTASYGPNAVTAAEYSLDPTVAAGAGTAFDTVTAGATTGTATGSVVIPASALTGKSGAVKVYVRGKDDQGNWGPTASGTLNIPTNGPKVTGLSVTPNPTNGQADVTLQATGDDSAVGSTVSAMSWGLTDGSCPVADCSMTLTTTGAVVAATATVPASYLQSLQDGPASLRVTATDALNLVGTGDVSFTMDAKGPVSNGPSGVEVTPNNGTIGSGVDPTMLKVYATFSDAGLGDSKIVAAEGFFNRTTALSDADNGTGFVFVANDGAFDSPTEPAYGLVPLTELTAVQDGPISIPVHAKDAAGNWGATSVITLQVDRTKPTVTGLTPTQQGGAAGRVQLQFTLGNPGTSPTNVVAAEYFLGTADPGAGNGTAVPGLTSPIAPGTVTATLQNLALGAQTVNVRVKDQAGNWSTLATTTFTVLTEPIFSDTFGTSFFGNQGNSNAWAGRSTGGNAPSYPVVTGMNGRFAMLTANGSGSSNVTTPTMTGGTNPPAGSYYARFLFRPNTLASAGGVNILVLRSGTTQRAVVQYRTTGSGTSTVRQVRVVNGTSTTGSGVGAWATLSGTSSSTYTLGLTWTGGTTTGSATLAVNGASVSTATGGGNGTTVSNAVLGTSGGTVTGQAYFDYYTASRFGMPA